MRGPIQCIDDLEALWRLWAAAEVEALSAKEEYLAALDHVQRHGFAEGGN